MRVQQGATLPAQEPHLQASTQTLAETPGPGPELRDMAVKEEATSKVTPIVTGEGATCAESPYQACNQPMVSCAHQQAGLLREPPSTCVGSEKCAIPESQSPPSLNPSPLEQRPIASILTSVAPSPVCEGGSYHFAGISTLPPSNEDNMTPGSSLEHFNTTLGTAKDHLASTTTCYSNNLTERLLSPQERDKTIEMAQPDEAEQTECQGNLRSSERSNWMKKRMKHRRMHLSKTSTFQRQLLKPTTTNF